jgi:O-antigen/teichoic acid export membrane protein
VPIGFKVIPKKILLKFQARPDLQGILGNIGWLTGERLFRMAGSLWVGAWVARYLGPSQYGQFNFALAYVGMFTALSALGIDGIIVRDLVNHPDQKDQILGSAFSLRLMGGLLATLLCMGSIVLLRPAQPLTHTLVGLIALGMIFQACDVVECWFRSQVQAREAVIAKNLVFVLSTAAKVILILVKAPLVAFAGISLAEIALMGLVLLSVYQTYTPKTHSQQTSLRYWRVNLTYIQKVLAESWAVILAGTALLLQLKVDQIMLSTLVGDAALGEYAAAVKLIDALIFIPIIIKSSVAASVTQAKQVGEAAYHQRLTHLYRLLFGLFLLTAVPLMLLAQPLTGWLLGDDYQQAGGLLTLLSARLFFVNLSAGQSLFIINESLFRYALFTSVLGLGLNIWLNYWLIPDYGTVGCIWAAIITSFVGLFGSSIILPPLRVNLRLMGQALLSPWKLWG